MTVNELTEDTNMEVGSDIKSSVKNPFFNIKLVNNNAQSFPPILAVLKGCDFSEDIFFQNEIIATPSSYKEGRLISYYWSEYDIYYYIVPDNMSVSDGLVNCHYDADNRYLMVDDPTKDASAVIISGS